MHGQRGRFGTGFDWECRFGTYLQGSQEMENKGEEETRTNYQKICQRHQCVKGKKGI